jgi:hypothetical protein
MPATLEGATLLLFTMHPATASFDQLLEQYIFTIAGHQLRSASPTTQTAILSLWQTIDDAATVANPVTTSSASQPAAWYYVLQKPINWRYAHQQWLQRSLRVRNQQHMAYLVRLKQVIATTHLHLQVIERSQLSQQTQARLSLYYQRTLHMYEHQLAQAEQLQDTYFSTPPYTGH